MHLNTGDLELVVADGPLTYTKLRLLTRSDRGLDLTPGGVHKGVNRPPLRTFNSVLALH